MIKRTMGLLMASLIFLSLVGIVSAQKSTINSLGDEKQNSLSNVVASSGGNSISQIELMQKKQQKDRQRADEKKWEEGFLDSAEISGIISGEDFSDSLNDPDVNGDGVVNFQDLLDLLANWGECNAETCIYDLNGDGDVGPKDLAILIGAWTDEGNGQANAVVKRVKNEAKGDGSDILSQWVWNGESCVKRDIITTPHLIKEDAVLRPGYIKLTVEDNPAPEGFTWFARIIPGEKTSAINPETHRFEPTASCSQNSAVGDDSPLLVSWWNTY